jgi:hypothetical protein
MDEPRDKERAAHEPEEPQKIEDLDVPGTDSEDVKGGGPIHTYSIQNAWPKKYSG